MSKINDYLPKVLQPILEFQQINSDLDVELNNINTLIKDIEKEVIVQTATEYGIKKWENALGIIPSDSDSLEVRRFRIINILTSKLPYTIRWLRSKLTEIVGAESGWTLNIDNNNYTITIVLSGLDTKLMLEVEKQLRNAIPSNMVLVIGGAPITSSEIRIGMAMLLAVKNEIVSGYTIESSQNLLTNEVILNWIENSTNPDKITYDAETRTISGTNLPTDYKMPNFSSIVEIPDTFARLVLENNTTYICRFDKSIRVNFYGIKKSNNRTDFLLERSGAEFEYKTGASFNTTYKGLFITITGYGETEFTVVNPIFKKKVEVV